MTDAWAERLSEYLDGDLSPADTRALELHLPECEDCRRALRELRNVVARLSADPVSPADQPTPPEWSALRRAIVPRRRGWLRPAALAASLIGAVLVGRYVLRSEVPPPASAYLRASAELEAVLRENQSRLRPETLHTLKASMAQIDRAITEAERALRADPANEYVARYVETLHQARLMTLRQAISIVHLRS